MELSPNIEDDYDDNDPAMAMSWQGISTARRNYRDSSSSSSSGSNDAEEVRDRKRKRRLNWTPLSMQNLAMAAAIFKSDIPQGVMTRLRASFLARIDVIVSEPGTVSHDGVSKKAFRRFFEESWVRIFIPEFLDAYYIYGVVPIVLAKDAKNRPVPHVARGLHDGKLQVQIALDETYRYVFRVLKSSDAHTHIISRALTNTAFGGDDDERLPPIWIAHRSEYDPEGDGRLNSVAQKLATFHAHFVTALQTGTILERARRTPKLLLENSSGRQIEDILAESMPDVEDDLIYHERARAMSRGTAVAHGGVQDSLRHARTAEAAAPHDDGWPTSVVMPAGIKYQNQIKLDEGLISQFGDVAKQYWRACERLLGVSSEYEAGASSTKLKEHDPYRERSLDDQLEFIARRLQVVVTELYRVAFNAPDAIVKIRVPKPEPEPAPSSEQQRPTSAAKSPKKTDNGSASETPNAKTPKTPDKEKEKKKEEEEEEEKKKKKKKKQQKEEEKTKMKKGKSD